MNEELPKDKEWKEFSPIELQGLKAEITQSGMDNEQAAEVVATFLSQRGFGADLDELRKITPDLIAKSAPEMAEELEKIIHYN